MTDGQVIRFAVVSARGGKLSTSTAASPRQALRFVREEIALGADVVHLEGSEVSPVLEAFAQLKSDREVPVRIEPQADGSGFRLAFDAGSLSVVQELEALASGPVTHLSRSGALDLFESPREPGQERRSSDRREDS